MSPITENIRSMYPEEHKFWEDSEVVREMCIRKVNAILGTGLHRGDTAKTAEDYVQSAIIRLSGKEVPYNSVDHLAVIITTTAFYIIADEDKQSRYKRRVDFEKAEIISDKKAGSNYDRDLERQLVKSEFYENLTEPQKYLVQLLLEGYSLPEIAQRAEVHRGVVYRQYGAMIKRLKEQAALEEESSKG